MEIMYMAETDKIKKYKVVKETEKQVVYIDAYGRERRAAKVTAYDAWFSTFEEAKKYLIENCKKSIERAIYAKETAEDRLYMVSQLTE